MSKGPKHTDHRVEALKRDRQSIINKCMKDAGGDTPAHLCSRVHDDDASHCSAYAFPEAAWRNGDCPMADEALRAEPWVERTRKGKVRVGQQKQKNYRRKKKHQR